MRIGVARPAVTFAPDASYPVRNGSFGKRTVERA
jgi:hypothetical protein